MKLRYTECVSSRPQHKRMNALGIHFHQSKNDTSKAGQRIIDCLFLGSKKGKEHVECNLDSVDVWNTPLVGNELEVDKVHNWPHLPGSLACSQEVVLDLASNNR
mmetsp:Transcript_24137/g.52079  ORF Transcript_24137/g.52079 Transcript_24137/m.52079 type:complete len:104 (-) Transcript_24137:634-945(-)